MTITCPVDLDTQRLRSEVSTIYSRVAAEYLGYDAAELATLPVEVTAPFAALPTRIASAQSKPPKHALHLRHSYHKEIKIQAQSFGPQKL